MKTKRHIDREELENQLNLLEEGQQFTNRSALYKAVCETPWGIAQNLSPPLIYLRVKEFQIPLRTPLGRRGGGTMEAARAQRSAGLSKKDKLAVFARTFQILRAKMPHHENIIQKAEEGSTKALIKLKCLDCCCDQREEIRNCLVVSCPLFPVRPYQ